MMPELSQGMAPGQKIRLSTEREISSIPKPEDGSGNKWEYPSSQQFYNALKRKGKEAPEENIDTMVAIHNFLNEGCWESKYHCDCKDLKLVKFQGRPDELSPLAWFYTTFMGSVKPFDRHDWTVNRCGSLQRYVIDYYSGPDDEDGNPTFSCDVRPALDSPAAVFDRIKDSVSSFWQRFTN